MSGREVVAPPAEIVVYLCAFRQPNQFYRTTIVKAGDRRVEITTSPTGRSVQVHVDGKRVELPEESAK